MTLIKEIQADVAAKKKEINDALFEGLAGVRMIAEGYNTAAIEFAKICDGKANSVEQRQAIKTARGSLKLAKELADVMQGDWGCWAEDRYKALVEQCFEVMSELRGPEAALDRLPVNR
jgi:hypothetical protein